MRALTFACMLIVTSIAYFVVRSTTTIGAVPPLPILAVSIGLGGVFILLVDIYKRIDRKLNRLPQPPYFIIDTIHGRCLELDADGSYESCQTLLNDLAVSFNAEFSNHLDPGPSPHSDKDKGYWNLTLFGQDFFLMRQGGYGICIWGPKPPADLSGFLRLAQHFNAIEFTTWQRSFLRAVSAPFARSQHQQPNNQAVNGSRRLRGF